MQDIVAKLVPGIVEGKHEDNDHDSMSDHEGVLVLIKIVSCCGVCFTVKLKGWSNGPLLHGPNFNWFLLLSLLLLLLLLTMVMMFKLDQKI